jgi:hypothetical protein
MSISVADTALLATKYSVLPFIGSFKITLDDGTVLCDYVAPAKPAPKPARKRKSAALGHPVGMTEVVEPYKVTKKKVAWLDPSSGQSIHTPTPAIVVSPPEVVPVIVSKTPIKDTFLAKNPRKYREVVSAASHRAARITKCKTKGADGCEACQIDPNNILPPLDIFQQFNSNMSGLYGHSSNHSPQPDFDQVLNLDLPPQSPPWLERQLSDDESGPVPLSRQTALGSSSFPPPSVH